MTVLHNAAALAATGRGRREGRCRQSAPVVLTIVVASVVAALAPTVPAGAAGVTCRGVRATIVGTPSSEVIHGTPGRDVIAGLGEDDTIIAGGGDDLVCGGDGADHLLGGAGRDRLYGERDRLSDADEDGVERIGDTLSGGPGDDRLFAGVDTRSADIVVLDVFSWSGSARGVRIDLRTGTARGEGADTFAGGTFTVVGSSYGDVVEGTDRRDEIETGPGPDVVRARGGDDSITVDGRLRGSGRNADTVWGGDGDDWITSTHGRDHLSGGAGDDGIESSGASNDVIDGGSGDDGLWAQIGDTAGPQSLDGGSGDDHIQINTDAINPRGEASTGVWNMATGAMTFTLDHTISLSVTHVDGAVLATRGTSWTVRGTAGDDAVSGDANGTAPVHFDGLAGDDGFRGTDGDDVFHGGPGDDRSFGMFGGDDTCTSVETIDRSDCEHVG
jgi:Ca2+-binding RTX toxin-like protein